MAQSDSRTYSGNREIIKIGNSLGVTLDQEGLREQGFDPEELVEEKVFTEVKSDRVIIDLSDVK